MLSKKQIELIEKTGIHFEQTMPPAAARILALLIVSDKEAYGFDEIKDLLKLSKSATSNGLSFLLGLKKVEYYTKSGDRKRYFRWSPRSIMKHFREGIENVLGLSAIFEEVLRSKQIKESSNYHQLEELTDLMNFLREEMPGVFVRWEQTRSTKQKVL